METGFVGRMFHQAAFFVLFALAVWARPAQAVGFVDCSAITTISAADCNAVVADNNSYFLSQVTPQVASALAAMTAASAGGSPADYATSVGTYQAWLSAFDVLSGSDPIYCSSVASICTVSGAIPASFISALAQGQADFHCARGNTARCEVGRAYVAKLAAGSSAIYKPAASTGGGGGSTPPVGAGGPSGTGGGRVSSIVPTDQIKELVPAFVKVGAGLAIALVALAGVKWLLRMLGVLPQRKKPDAPQHAAHVLAKRAHDAKIKAARS